MNTSISLSGADKIEEDQTLAAACLLVCEWANKLLGRVFGTLVELARFLVGGSYVSSKSMAAFVVMSSTDCTPQVSQCLATLMSPLKPGDPVNPKRRPNSQQTHTKSHQRQQQKSVNHVRAPLVSSATTLLQHTPQKSLVSDVIVISYSTARAYGNLHSRVRAASQFPHSRVFFLEYS